MPGLVWAWWGDIYWHWMDPTLPILFIRPTLRSLSLPTHTMVSGLGLCHYVLCPVSPLTRGMLGYSLTTSPSVLCPIPSSPEILGPDEGVLELRECR